MHIPPVCVCFGKAWLCVERKLKKNNIFFMQHKEGISSNIAYEHGFHIQFPNFVAA